MTSTMNRSWRGQKMSSNNLNGEFEHTQNSDDEYSQSFQDKNENHMNDEDASSDSDDKT